MVFHRAKTFSLFDKALLDAILLRPSFVSRSLFSRPLPERLALSGIAEGD
jgi:hypothetical protein